MSNMGNNMPKAVMMQRDNTHVISGKTIPELDPGFEDMPWDYEVAVQPSVSFDHGVNVRCKIGHLESFVTFGPDGAIHIRYAGEKR